MHRRPISIGGDSRTAGAARAAAVRLYSRSTNNLYRASTQCKVPREGEDRRWQWKGSELKEGEAKGGDGKEREVTTCCPISNELSPPMSISILSVVFVVTAV